MEVPIKRNPFKATQYCWQKLNFELSGVQPGFPITSQLLVLLWLSLSCSLSWTCSSCKDKKQQLRQKRFSSNRYVPYILQNTPPVGSISVHCALNFRCFLGSRGFYFCLTWLFWQLGRNLVRVLMFSRRILFLRGNLTDRRQSYSSFWQLRRRSWDGGLWFRWAWWVIAGRSQGWIWGAGNGCEMKLSRLHILHVWILRHQLRGGTLPW